MARKPREWYPGAFLHVMSRGNRKDVIFRSPQDYAVFLHILKSVREKVPFDLHAFCLMTNHFHLLLGTKEEHVASVMQPLLKNYAKYFNKKYDLVGHLFQGRYTSRLVRNDLYFMEVSRYIHLNPVKAGLVLLAEDYPYSSYQAYINSRNIRMLDKSRVLSFFGGDNESGIKNYRQFVESSSVYEDEIRKDIREDEMWLPKR